MNSPLILSELTELRAQLDALTLEDWAFLAANCIEIAAALWAVRSVCIIVFRALGISHPGQYRYFPRLPWRSALGFWMTFSAWRERVFRFGKMSSGGFSSALATLTLLYRPDKLFLGRAYGLGLSFLQPLGIKVTRHIKMFAMTGAGKTTLLISMLSCWRGSALVVDPKGQITYALAGKDRKRKWKVFDPYGISSLPSIGFNVFDCIKQAVERDGVSAAVLWAQRIAQCLISTPEGAKSPYFYDISRGFITGLILHVLTAHPNDDHNLPTIRSLIIEGYRVFCSETGQEETNGNEAFYLLLHAMKQNPAFDGVIAGAAAALENAGKETLGNILSTLLEQTKWLDVPAVRQALMHSDISLADLKTRDDIVLSLVAPVFSVREELKDCFRLVLNMSAYTFQDVKKKKGQCLFVVDEMPSLGHNPTFEVLIPVARSQGITFLGISQDIEILQKAYPKSWETFIGNADLVFWMGSNHERTLKYLSGVLGRKTLVETDPYSGRKSYREVTVASPDQLRRFLNPDSGRMIITRPGKRAIKLVNDPYFKALPVTAYNADPDHQEPLLRRVMRFLLGQRNKPAAQIHTPCLPPVPQEETPHE
jgi:type IV secretory pathway TraG/TraD family ATPase VirD4